VADPATFTTPAADDEELGEDLGGLDDLLASLRKEEEPAAPKRGRGRAKKEAAAKDFKIVLWASADKLRAQMDAAEYKHLVLGLIFLKFISDTFTEHQPTVLARVSDPASDYYVGDDPADHQAALDDRDYYKQDNVFWVSEAARWEVLRAQAKQPTSAPASMPPWWRSRTTTRFFGASWTGALGGRNWSQAASGNWWI
jgi:type I restriction-modification system DNA methylase subunit